MRYPKKLSLGDTIGICAPSCGIEPEKVLRLDAAEEALRKLGFNVIETKNVRNDNLKGRSASGKIRAEEFMELYENKDVSLIIFACGGDFLVEMLEYLDFEYIRTLEPKWIQGYSDCTGLVYLFTTILEIPSMYHQTIKDFAMEPLHKSLQDALKLLEGNEVIQESFDMCEGDWNIEEKISLEEEDVHKGYDLKEKVIWKNLNGEEKIEMQGRAIGGCLDCIMSFVGTKYDKVNDFLEKYKEDGFIWFFDCFETGSSKIFLNLWQLKNAGYFKYCKGIIFGRPLFVREDYEIPFNESIKDVINDLNIPIIVDADVGHKSPQLAMLNGSYIKVISENGKGKLETKLI